MTESEGEHDHDNAAAEQRPQAAAAAAEQRPQAAAAADAESRKVVAEIFCGSGNLSRALEVYFVAHQYDLQIDVSHDFSKWARVEKIAAFLMASGCRYVHMAPPCNTYSNARYPKIRSVGFKSTKI